MDFARWASISSKPYPAPDGAFGQHPGRAFATGGVAASFLRMGMKVNQRETVVGTIKAGQQPDGAWSKDDGPSDLSSSYRVMRALYMLKEKPDAERLTGYIARCRKADGSYSNRPGSPGSLGATYFASIISGAGGACSTANRPCWRNPPSAPLFNTTDLTGWEGNTALLVGTRPDAGRHVAGAGSQ